MSKECEVLNDTERTKLKCLGHIIRSPKHDKNYGKKVSVDQESPN